METNGDISINIYPFLQEHHQTQEKHWNLVEGYSLKNGGYFQTFLSVYYNCKVTNVHCIGQGPLLKSELLHKSRIQALV